MVLKAAVIIGSLSQEPTGVIRSAQRHLQSLDSISPLGRTSVCCGVIHLLPSLPGQMSTGACVSRGCPTEQAATEASPSAAATATTSNCPPTETAFTMATGEESGTAASLFPALVSVRVSLPDRSPLTHACRLLVR